MFPITATPVKGRASRRGAKASSPVKVATPAKSRLATKAKAAPSPVKPVSPSPVKETKAATPVKKATRGGRAAAKKTVTPAKKAATPVKKAAPAKTAQPIVTEEPQVKKTGRHRSFIHSLLQVHYRLFSHIGD